MLLKRTELRRALGASAWLLGHRAVALATGLVGSVLVARYLGPADFGRLSFAIAFVALLGTVQHLGLVGLVTQALVREPEGRDEILGSVFALKLLGGLAIVLIAIPVGYMLADTRAEWFLISLVSFATLFEAGAIFRLYFEAEVQGRPVAIVMSAALLISLALRIAAIALAAPLWVFGVIFTAQVAMTSLGLWVGYNRRGHSVRRWRISAVRMRSLLSKSWPIMISSASAVVYLKIDQLMLGKMNGMAGVGTYAVAARISELTYALPTVLAGAIFPRLVQLHEQDRGRYDHRIRQSIDAMFWAGLCAAIGISLISGPFIALLFGAAYTGAGSILSIHIWACPAMFMGIIVQRWHMADNLQHLLIPRQVAGAAANVALNWLLIPSWGGIGAAIATVLSYTLAQYVLMFSHRRTRILGWWMTLAIFAPLSWLAAWRSENMGKAEAS